MKNKTLIIAGILVILVVMSVWTYLLFFGTPKGPDGVFSNFGQNDNLVFPTETQPEATHISNKDEVLSTEKVLYRLTNKPVAAAVFTDNGIRFVEQGTGYIYDIDLVTKEETQTTNTTIPRVVSAVFSKSGNTVAMTSDSDGVVKTIVGTIIKNDFGEGVIDGALLPKGSRELVFSNTGREVFYLIETADGSIGYKYDVSQQTQTQLFSVPLADIRVLWGNDIYVYTKPSYTQDGYIYLVENNHLTYTTPGLPGLTAQKIQNELFVSNSSNTSIETSLIQNSHQKTEVVLRLFLEKCTENNTSTSSIYCTAPQSIHSGSYPDDWYKGIVSFSDELWEYDFVDNIGYRKTNFLDVANKEIDVVALGNSTNGTYLYLINKNDNGLWLYNTTLD